MAEAAKLVVYGPDYSAYVRIVLLVLQEKGLTYTLEPLDLLSGAPLPADYLRRHPFARVPLLQHADFELYETAAITDYLEEIAPQPPLRPSDPRRRARLRQLVHIVDSYAYWPMVRQVFLQRALAPLRGADPDEGIIAAGLKASAGTLDAIERLIEPDGYLVGPALSLADLHAAPMIFYFTQAPEGAALLAERPALADWWQRLAARPSVREVCRPLQGPS